MLKKEKETKKKKKYEEEETLCNATSLTQISKSHFLHRANYGQSDKLILHFSYFLTSSKKKAIIHFEMKSCLNSIFYHSL